MTATEDRARSIFLAALDRAPDTWPAFLDEACGPDAELRSRVAQLLHAHEVIGSIHQDHANAPTAEAAGPPAEGPGTVIGSYKLVEEIGEGGMGTVFLAQQTEPVRRVVALKVIKAGMDTRQVIARFEAERQALALMDHPNIAKVLDAGTTPAGRPYFVMELVKGVPITKYCDEKRLTPRERLELFLPVCHAIQHAHQKGIIHRDLKPSNVMVALYDGKPVPKVIDFGVAKAAGQPLTEKTLVTRLGAVVGTPEYMSPEQAELNQLDVDTRSDVYSLGVLLYELLTGTTPLKHKRVKEAALLEVLRIIREEEPQRPSTRLSTTAELPSIAANRGLEPKKLSGLIRGELDWIVMKALEKDRDRRYETANGLGRDIERYLHDEPVQACPPSAAYRLRKLVRRNKGPALVATALFAVLVAVALGATVAAFREQRLKREAEESAKSAQESAKSAQESADSERASRQQLEQSLYFERIALAADRLAADNRDQVDELLEQCPEPLRGWEWYYLKRWLQAEPCVELRGHTHFVSGVAFHPDGRRLASGSGDSTVRIWDRTTGKQARPPLYGHFGSVMDVAFSPDGKYLGSASFDKTVKIWDMATGKALHTLPHEDRVCGVAFSPDSQLVASAARDKTVRIWEASTGRAVHTCRGHAGLLNGVAFSPDGRRLASADFDGTVKLWDVATGQETLSWREASPGLPGLAFRPGGHHLAVACGRAVYLHDLADGRLERTLRGHSVAVSALAFSPDGRRLASGGADRDNTVKLWDPETGREILTLRGHSNALRGVAFSPDGRHLATASNDQTIKVWDAPDRAEGAAALVQTIRLYKNQDEMLAFRGVAFHTDGQRLAAGYLDGTVRVWDRDAGKEAAVFRVGNFAVPVTGFSPDGSRLAATDMHGESKVWDLATGRELWSRSDTGTSVNGMAFSPDNRWLAFADYFSGAITVQDASTGQPVKTFRHASDLVGVDFSPDGRLLASYVASGTVKIWKTDTFQEFRTLQRAGLITRVRFSPDNRRLATANYDKTVRLWDLETGQEIIPEFRGHSHPVQDVDFSPDGRALASAGGTEALVWNGSNGQVLRRFRGHAGLVLLAKFSPDGRRLFTIGEDSTLKVWDLALSPLDWHGAEARKLVDERFAKLLLRDDVVASLRADKVLGDDVREVAVQLAEEHDEDPLQLVKAVVPVIQLAGGDAAAYRLALRRQEAACRLFPENGMFLGELAVAHFRLGHYKEAAATLRVSVPLNKLRFEGSWPADLALAGLLQLQAGRPDEARATADRLRELMKGPRWTATNSPFAADLMHELEGLLDQKDGDDAKKPKHKEKPHSPPARGSQESSQ